LLKNQKNNNQNINLDKIIDISNKFSNTWRRKLENIHSDILNYFTNFATGSDLFQIILTHLLLHYKKFEDIAKTMPNYDQVQHQIVSFKKFRNITKDFTLI